MWKRSDYRNRRRQARRRRDARRTRIPSPARNPLGPIRGMVRRRELDVLRTVLPALERAQQEGGSGGGAP
jgi:hypothetical protein